MLHIYKNSLIYRQLLHILKKISDVQHPSAQKQEKYRKILTIRILRGTI